MIQKKVCMLGGFAVGKTSLVARFVTSIFSDKYLTTVGVKIEKKSVQVSNQQLDLVLWDIYGDDEFQRVRMSYLRGASGYLLVVDPTRKATLETAIALQDSAEKTIGRMPFVVVLNKADLIDQWEIDEHALDDRKWTIIRTSAKTGTGVEEAFLALARAMASGAN
jgi:small GTP-binding protein